ncbi:MAG: hypothetical protein SNF33_04190 [Candidatus Algichlamydia australiensis]|nr:hypothetical protein [Chlamydiales bacterium]
MKLIRNTFRFFGKIIGPIYLLNTLFCLPLVALSFFLTAKQQLNLFPAYNIFTLVLLETFAILTINAIYKDQAYKLRDNLKIAASKYGKILLFLLVFTIIFLLCSMLFVVPSLVVAIMAFFMFPILVLEDLTIKEAWKKSRALTKGYRWRLLGYTTLIGLFFIIFFLAIGSLAFFDESVISTKPIAMQILFRVLFFPIDCLASVWIMTFTTVTYLKRLERPLPPEYSANEEKVALC